MTPAGFAEHVPLVPLASSKIFALFFVMLGPFKLVAPFARMTRGLSVGDGHRVAVKACGIACGASLVAGAAGETILDRWGVSPAALLAAVGLVLLLVALRTVLAQYASLDLTPELSGSSQVSERPRHGLPTAVAFPHIVTPYGTAGLVLLLAAYNDAALPILGMFLLVMGLDLAAMWFVRPILKYGTEVLAILGAVLGVLQVALAMQMLLTAGRLVGVVPAVLD